MSGTVVTTSPGSRCVLVTGAGSGIGRAVCGAALGRGWKVVGVDLDTNGLQETARVGPMTAIVCDVTDEDAVTAVFTRATEQPGGPPDAVVAAAGVYAVRPALETAAEDFRRVLEINTVGAFVTARGFAAARTKVGGGGSVVLISSIASQVGDRDEPGVAYAASKGAVVAMTRQLAVEWAPHSIRVNAVSPGVIDTPMLRLTEDPQRAAAYLRAGVPLGRLGTAGEVATACLFLLEDASAYVTGAVLAVDGGASVV